MKSLLYFGGLLFLAGVPLVRILVFLIDRMSNTSLPSDVYLLVAWAERFLLLLLSGILLIVALPGAVFGIGMGRAFSPSSQADVALILLIPIGIYVLGAFVMNFPWFPLSLHSRVIRYWQLLLLPLVGFTFMGGVILLLPALLFAGLWFLCLNDRQTYEA